MTTNAANHDTGRIAPDLTAAGNGQASPQVAPKGLHLVPVSEFVEGETVVGRIFHCSGPTGPCVLELGHAGDHVRPFVHAEPVPARDLAAENAELRSLLRVAAVLLKDWPFERGASFRRGLVAKIERAIR